MNNSTNAPDFFERIFRDTPAGNFWHHTTPFAHVLIIIAFAFGVHLLVELIRLIGERLILKSHAKKNPLGFVTARPKFVTLTRLIVSAVTFVVYFLAIGLVLVAIFHFSDTFLKTYLSSAAVVGLALSFGLQGLVQDVVTGVTLIVSNAIDVNDVIDVSGVIGRVEQIGLRFTKIINFYNQEIFVPNRNIANVARFPRGGIYAYADVQVPRQAEPEKVTGLVHEVSKGTWTQFGAIILAEPEVGKLQVASPAGWNFIRVQFKIWPGQTLIETTYKSQIVSAMKVVDPNYADWMVAVTYRAINTMGTAPTEPSAPGQKI